MLLNKHNLAIAALASKDETRHDLVGLHVTATCTEATDGHRAARVTLPNDDPADFPSAAGVALNGTMPSLVAPIPAVKALAKAIPGKSRHPILRNALVDTAAAEGGTFKAVVTDLETTTPIEARALDVRFPDFDAIMPKSPPYVSVGINGKYLSEVAKIAADMADGRACAIRLEIPAPNETGEVIGPVVIRVSNAETGQEGVFLIMPVRLRA